MFKKKKKELIDCSLHFEIKKRKRKKTNKKNFFFLIH